MRIQIVSEVLPRTDFEQLFQEAHLGDMIKAVADIDQGILALGGELHSDAEAQLLSQGSKQASLWGFNIYPTKLVDARIQYTSLINIRPQAGNTTLTLKDPVLQKKIADLVRQLLPEIF